MTGVGAGSTDTAVRAIASDGDENARGPRLMARTLEARIVELTARRKARASASEDERLRMRSRAARSLLRWCKTRAGY